MNELDREIAAAQIKLNETENDGPEWVKASSFLASLLLERFMQTTSSIDLTTAIALLENSIDLMSDDYTARKDVLYNYASGLLMDFRINRSVSHLSKILWAFENALLSAPTEYALRPTILKIMGDLLLQETFPQTKSLDELDRAIEFYKKGLQCVSLDIGLTGELYNNLGVALQERFRQTGSRDDLDQAVEAKESAVKCSPQNNGLRVRYLCNLGNVYKGRFHHTGFLDDLHRGVALNQEAVDISSKIEGVVSLHDHARLLLCLGTGLHARFAVTRFSSDLDGALHSYSEAIKVAAEEDRSVVLCNLGNAFISRYEWAGSVNDLNQATVALEEALAHSSEQDRRVILSNINETILLNFDRSGSTEDLNRAITFATEAVKTTIKGHILREGMLYALSKALRIRYLRFRATEDLNGAIALMEGSLETCRNDLHRRSRYGDLATYLRDRFSRTGSVQDLDRGIVFCEEALKLTQITSSEIPRLHCILGTLLAERFESCSRREDIDMAIAAHETALQHEFAQERPRLQWNLGSSLKIRFECTRSTEDLNRAIDCFREALEALESDNSEKAKCLINLGRLLHLRTQSNETSYEAVSVFESALKCISAAPFERLVAAGCAVEILPPFEAEIKCRLLSTAVELLPLTSPPSLRQADQQYILSQFPHMASAAAAYALQAGKSAFEALTLLEIGRGVIATHRMEINPDLESLQTLYPVIAQEFMEARDRFDVQHVRPDKFFDYLDLDTTRRHSSAAEFQAIVDRIRKLDGFERFLLGPSEEEVKSIALHGSLVVLNVAELRSDAIIVSSESIRSLSLPSLRYTEVKSKAKALIEALDRLTARTYHGTNTLLTNILEWLWDSAISLVLDDLGYLDAPSKDAPWPHVWWVTVGWLSLFPLHAAGYNGGDSSKNALDRVVSSYSPTLKALTYSKRKGTTSTAKEQAVLVSMAHTSCRKDLPQALNEVKLLESLLPAAIQKYVLTTPTKSEVLSKLQTCTMAHFACHGYSTPDDPSKSCLLLRDWQDNPMTVEDVQSLRRKGLSVAYLSACHTARSRYERLLDEGINIAAAFQLAGFPSVIGTLWNVDDKSSVEIAKNVYSAILAGGKMDVHGAARGLHFALRRIREEQLKDSRFKTSDPLAWAAFIHVGV